MRKRWWFIGGAVIVAAIGVGSMTLFGGNKETGLPVSVAAVMQADLQNEVLTSGKAEVPDEITLYANAEGTLHAFTIEEGDTIKKGQPIGTIDTADVDSRILQLEAQIEQQNATMAKTKAGEEPETIAQLEEKARQEERNLQTAMRDLRRIEQLYASGAVTSQDLDKAKDALAVAQSALKVAKEEAALKKKGARSEDIASIQAQIKQYLAEKSQLQKDQKQSVILAPADGTVLTVKAINGQRMSKGTEVLTLGNLSRLVIEADVNESDVHKIKLGQEATISGSSLGKETIPAKVTRISPIAVTTESKSGNSEQTRVKVTLELLKRSSVLRPGYHVDINIVTDNIANAVQVPFEAVQQDKDGSSFLWMIDHGKAKKQKVKVGLENELFTQIVSGIKPGQEVIVNPPEGLQENIPVMKMESGSQPEGM